MYEDYIERFRNLSYLEDQLELYNGSEQDREAVRLGFWAPECMIIGHG